MASGTITSWQVDGETMETVTDFILGGSKIPADGTCCHETKRCLLLGRKAVTNVDSILKSKDITLLKCEMSGSLNIIWHCPSLGLEQKLTFSSPAATAEFSIFAGILSAAL